MLFVVLLIFIVLFSAKVHAEQKVTTIGNSSYIDLRSYNLEAPMDDVSAILQTIKDFEVKHPDLRVLSWAIEKNQRGKASYPFVFGIWIVHEPR